jgi:hypothetical protein
MKNIYICYECKKSVPGDTPVITDEAFQEMRFCSSDCFNQYNLKEAAMDDEAAAFGVYDKKAKT